MEQPKLSGSASTTNSKKIIKDYENKRKNKRHVHFETRAIGITNVGLILRCLRAELATNNCSRRNINVSSATVIINIYVYNAVLYYTAGSNKEETNSTVITNSTTRLTY
ncbi:hypothetical protein WUBG_10375 [Wuchereria bancrofti]|uniref:Uncharacterized protein n=1 Tax=Wuchereria bancrofti TaxID=6293 RepID=J9AVZ1_WUCBA|nr:hypothetical protein WUBG_10375 [Wuchereria bancrofti]